MWWSQEKIRELGEKVLGISYGRGYRVQVMFLPARHRDNQRKSSKGQDVRRLMWLWWGGVPSEAGNGAVADGAFLHGFSTCQPQFLR